MGRISQLAVVLAVIVPLYAEGLSVPVRDADELCRAGDSYFRHSRFEQADQVYRAALTLSPSCARAHWGLGRLASLHSRWFEARDLFSRAYRLDPRDPDIVLSFASWAEDASARVTLLQNYLALTEGRDPARRADALAKAEMAQRLGDRRTATLVSPYRPYSFKLTGFFPRSAVQTGVLLEVRIGAGRPLSLVLDTGADGIVVRRKSLANVPLEKLADAMVSGLGGSTGVPAEIVLAPSVEIADLKMRDVPIQVLDRDFVPGADGVIGTDVFKDFLVQLDLRAAALELLPLPGQPRDGAVAATALRLDHLLLIPASTNGEEAGYFLLDTGSSFSALASVPASGRAGSTVEVSSPAAILQTAACVRPLRFSHAGTHLVDPHPVSADLASLSRALGAEVSGIVGYPLLKSSVITINYREGRVEIAK